MSKLKFEISESHAFLLKSIIGSGQDTLHNYEKWISSVNISNDLDGESYTLIPALYKALDKIGFYDKNMTRYMGIYKKSFYKNGLLLSLLHGIGNEFNKHNIPFTLIKGIPVIINYHHDFGVRGMSNLDILIDMENFPKAIEILNNNGFFCECGYDVNKNIKIWHSHSFINNNGIKIELYRTAFPVCCSGIPFDQPREFLYQDIKYSMPSPEDFILQICLHAASSDQAVHISWIYDLHSLIMNEPEIKWNIIADKLKNTMLSYVFFIMFECFNEISSIKIPESIVETLYENGNNRTCIKDARKKFKKPKTLFGKLGWYRYNQQNKDLSILKRIIGFPRYILMLSKYTRYIDLMLGIVKKYILKRSSY